MSKTTKIIAFILIVLILDQTLKIWIKTHMMLGQEYMILGEWFRLHFIENNGMAFGMEFAGKAGKMILSIFRILAVIGIGWYLNHLIQKNESFGLIISIAAIFAGALGNIIDSAFYGIIFNDSYFQVAKMFPEEGGYASFLHGRVVDMFYFPIIRGTYPEWFPWKGGQNFIFFRPVFNIADSAITLGVASILIFQKRFFAHHD
jgi:signal peptidase II